MSKKTRTNPQLAGAAPALQPGDPAPDFTLPLASGGAVRLSEFRGRALALFFFPKADTEGCTREALDFSERLAAFEGANAVVLGVSPDPLARLARFRDKHGLAAPLASDEAHTACEAYGVWAEKSMYGRTFMGIVRSTFLIDAAGRIARVWRNLRVAGHAEEVLEAVRRL